MCFISRNLILAWSSRRAWAVALVSEKRISASGTRVGASSISLKSGRAFRSESSIGVSSEPVLFLISGAVGVFFSGRGAGGGLARLGAGCEKGIGERFTPADGLRERGEGASGAVRRVGGREPEGSAARAAGEDRARQANPSRAGKRPAFAEPLECAITGRRVGKFMCTTFVQNARSACW